MSQSPARVHRVEQGGVASSSRVPSPSPAELQVTPDGPIIRSIDNAVVMSLDDELPEDVARASETDAYEDDELQNLAALSANLSLYDNRADPGKNSISI